MEDGQGCPTGTKKLPRQSFGKVQVKILSQNGAKMDENAEKCRKQNLNLSHLELIYGLSHTFISVGYHILTHTFRSV